METVRFAPSPTGWLHIGHAYSAAFAKDAARGGRYILRIEDIDQGRSRDEFIDAIFEDLQWLGIEWEQPPTFQSKRLQLYESALARLIEQGCVYPCFCSRKDIAEALQAPHKTFDQYPGTCRLLSKKEAAQRIDESASFAWRLDVSLALERIGPLTWNDRKRGVQTVHSGDIGDPIVGRKDAPTSYHLSSVVDDADHGISLVTRGEDLVDATPIHRILQELLGLAVPEYEHHPLVGDAHGNRLSKRDHSVSLRQLRESGMTPYEVLEVATARIIH